MQRLKRIQNDESSDELKRTNTRCGRSREHGLPRFAKGRTGLMLRGLPTFHRSLRSNAKDSDTERVLGSSKRRKHNPQVGVILDRGLDEEEILSDLKVPRPPFFPPPTHPHTHRSGRISFEERP
eukprot:scaffold301_cov243-Pinguiococcus_pyrenoidosus.AAC.35